ncbi:related to Origin recognition complex subunit 4 [Ustilago trichophora]|uniref:Related to Origin recognition complex subunit 4 n=1 Tax=Ustilago trichophora TaxID=86804 RepID=A0A5C3DQ11_9BASI|nr:related to Origin recognition complex subunit 4 [Ustilago trichophora]
MPTAKRKATASPAASDDDGAALEIDQQLSDTEQPSSNKRPNLSSTSSLQSSESTLRQLQLEILEQLLPLQKRRCLETLVGGLPPIPTDQPPVASTSTLPSRPIDDEDDEDAAVFTDTTKQDNNSSTLTNQASACVGLQDEWHTLHSMLHATVTREESNSCLLIGAAGSGKSLLVDSVLQSIASSSSSKDGAESKPYYHVHLAGTVQINDRSAMKEMAQQLILQGAFTEDDVGEAMDTQSLSDDDDEQGPSTKAGGDDHVFGGEDSDEDSEIAPAVANNNDEEAEIQDELAGAILSSLNNIIAHIIALLSNTSSSNPAGGATGGRKPLVITLDDFDLFTARPRQAMLYCLLDAVQAASYGAGLAVVGLTSRVDTVDLLEKRVKSRFSHRILHVRPPSSYELFERIVRNALSPLSRAQLPTTISPDHYGKFTTSWTTDITTLLNHPHIHDILRGIYELSNDIRMLYRVLTPAIAKLDLLEPAFDLPLLLSTASVEVGDGMLSILRDLTEPEMALLIAVKHLQTRDRSVFNFEMCYDELRRFAARDARERQAASTGSNSLELGAGAASAAAAAGGGGGGGGVLSGSAVTTPFYADRKIALMAFHTLLSLEFLLPENYVSSLSISNPVAKPSAVPFAGQTGRANQNTIRKEFWKVRCILTPNLIVQAVKDRQRPVAVSSALVKWASSHG